LAALAFMTRKEAYELATLAFVRFSWPWNRFK
jgi:hypothetical protein